MNVHSVLYQLKRKFAMAKQKKREDIILSAMGLIAKKGFHGAPMSMIAEKAGVGIGTINRYFENRDMLIEAIYKEKRRKAGGIFTEKIY